MRTIAIVALIFGFITHFTLACAEEGDTGLSRRDKIFAIHPLSNMVCWAVGNKGLMLKTSDGGDTWDRLDRITALSLNDVFFLNERGWVVGQDGFVLETKDGGTDWKEHSRMTEATLMKVYFVDENNGFIIGEMGTLFRTVNGGKTWETQSIDWMTILPDELILEGILGPTLYDIFFINAMEGWIVGDNGVVFKSTDSGSTWELQRIGLYPHLFSVLFRNEKEGWATGQNGVLLSTQDGGVNWAAVEIAAEDNLYNIIMSNQSGLVVGDRGAVFKTVDGGITWRELDLGLAPPTPFIADAWITTNNATRQLLLMGERIIRIRNTNMLD